jgi:hypothetical protein
MTTTLPAVLTGKRVVFPVWLCLSAAVCASVVIAVPPLCGVRSVLRFRLQLCPVSRRRVDPPATRSRPSFRLSSPVGQAGSPSLSARAAARSSSVSVFLFLSALSTYPPPSAVVCASLPLVLRRPEFCAPPSQDHSVVVGVGCVRQLRSRSYDLYAVARAPGGAAASFFIHARPITDSCQPTPARRRC